MSPNTEQKSVLDLALEMGVRAETVLQSLRDMGLSVDESVSLDSDIESAVVEHMIDNGSVSSRLAKGKGRRKRTEEPIVDDEILTEALGASENGFSDANVPRQILFESGFEKKSFLQKWFGKKKDIAVSLKENPISEDAIESMFAAPLEVRTDRELSPFQEIEQQEQVLAESSEPSKPAAPPKSGVKEKPSVPEPPPIDDEILEEDMEGIEDLDLDEDLLGDMEDIEIGEGDDIDDIAAEDLEDLGEFNEEVDGLELGEMDEDGLDGEDLEMDFDEEIESEEGEGDQGEGPGGDEEDEDAHVPGFAERFFSRIQLTPTEMWVLLIGSGTTMLFLLGVTITWYYYSSPTAINDILKQADAAYSRAVDEGKEIDQWRNRRVAWSKPRKSLTDAADLYAKYIDKHPSDQLSEKTAFKNMCDCYYRIAMGDKQEGDKENTEIAFRKMATYYERFLKLLEEFANQNIKNSEHPELAYPSIEEQKESLYRIALAKRELEQFDQTIQSLQDFVDRFRDTDQALEAMIEIGNSYWEWAKSKKDQEITLLDDAVNAYKNALDKIPQTDYLRRMKLYAKIGDVKYRLYERSSENDKTDEANQHLSEVIANYELAVDEARKESLRIEQDPPGPLILHNTLSDIQQVRKRLGDVYLLRGKEAGKQWKELETTAEPFSNAILYKQQLLEAAKREQETTHHFLQQANTLYDQLLDQTVPLESKDYEDILYNKTDSFYIMRDYPQALASGERLLSSTTSTELTDDTKTKILYLLGNAAWERAKETGDYTQVKDYYYKALEQDWFYPAEEKGDTSHLADIRLINAYYLIGKNKDYPSAIRRWKEMVDKYPESGYAYLTFYYYAKTLEEYGDELSRQMRELREEAKNSGNANALLVQARQLEKDSRDNYDLAVAQYNRAIQVRDDSKYVDTQNQRYLKEIMYNRGHCAFKEGNYREAEGYYKEALNKYGNDKTAEKYKPLAIERLGDLNANLFSYDSAIDYYQQYLDNAYENENMRITKKLADAYLNRYSWDKAREWYRKIINNDPKFPTPNQVDMRLRRGAPLEAGPGYDAMKMIAESFRREAATSSDEVRLAKLEEALKAYQELAQSFPLGPDKDRTLPADSDSLNKMGGIQFELGKYADAANSYEKFLTLEPNFPRQGRINYTIGQAYMKLGEFDKAIDRLSLITQETLDNSLQYADALILLGQAYQSRAALFRDEPDGDALYIRYLQRAQRTYNRVGITNEPKKIQEANTLSSAIDSLIRSSAELAASNTP